MRLAGVVTAIAVLALGCTEPPPESGPIRISAPGFDPRGGSALQAEWDRDGTHTPVTLPPGEKQGPWTRFELARGDGAPAGTLLAGPSAAVLVYHAAASTPSFAAALMPTRLALIDPEREGAPAKLALWLTGGLPSGDDASNLSLADLAVDEAAPLLATAMALGAWDRLALDRFPRGGDGVPRLPPFVPEPPGDWSDLRGTSLEGFLPDDMAQLVIETPDLRAQTYLLLGRLTERLDPLSRRVEELAASLPAPLPAALLETLKQLLAAHADSLSSYLDSVWIEQALYRMAPDRIRMSLDIHSVVPVRVEAFAMTLDAKLALAHGEAIGSVRLIDRETGESVTPRISDSALIFPIGLEIEPVPLGPYRFGTTRLSYEIEGLDRSPALRDRMLEELAARVVRHDGSSVSGDHVRRIWSIVDRRFSAAHEETPAEFAAALPERLAPEDGAPGARLSGDALSIPAGRHHLRDDLILPPELGLRIEAGATISVDPGHSILVRGPLRIEGRAEQPVRIGRADEATPWGVLAAQGKGVTRPGGSPRLRAVVRHLELDGGSEDQLRGVWYTGQLSVYHQDLELSDSTLSRSANQDNLNVNRGSVEVRDCRFLESGDDAVDFDWATGSVRRSLIQGMGPDGDGVDVAGSTLNLEDVVISDAGDKCVSAGERSQVEIRGALMRRCETAIASKDSSRVVMGSSIVLDVGAAYDAYEKSSVFGPPELLVESGIGARIRRPDRLSPDATLRLIDVIQIEPAPAASPGSRLIRLPANSKLGMALAGTEMLQTEHFDVKAFRELRALVPKDARPQ